MNPSGEAIRMKIVDEFVKLRVEQNKIVDSIEQTTNLYKDLGIEIDPELKKELEKLKIH